jgi:hypothetical protein
MYKVGSAWRRREGGKDRLVRAKEVCQVELTIFYTNVGGEDGIVYYEALIYGGYVCCRESNIDHNTRQCVSGVKLSHGTRNGREPGDIESFEEYLGNKLVCVSRDRLWEAEEDWGFILGAAKG